MLLSRHLPRFLALTALVIQATAGRAAAEEKSRALEIFDAALAKFEADHVALRQWQYHQTLTTHQTDSSGRVIAKGTWKSIVRPGDHRPLEYTEKSVEGHLTFFQADSNENAKFPTHSATPSTIDHSRQKNQLESTVDMVRKYNLRDRYVWQRLPDEMVGGESAYVLSFSPKPNQNTSTREERFFFSSSWPAFDQPKGFYRSSSERITPGPLPPLLGPCPSDNVSVQLSSRSQRRFQVTPSQRSDGQNRC